MLEVQTSLTHLVLLKPGQKRVLVIVIGHQVDAQFPTADGETRDRGFPGAPAGVGVLVDTLADNAS